MVECAIYFPLVIICLAFTVLMFIHFYSITVLSAHVHMTVRDEAGLRNGTTILEMQNNIRDRHRAMAENIKVRITAGNDKLRAYVSGIATEKYGGGKLTGDKYVTRKCQARSYLINEKLIVRLKSIAVD